MKRIGAMLLLTTALLSACSSSEGAKNAGVVEENKLFERAMDQGKLALADDKLSKAYNSFELALDEKKDSKEAKQYINELGEVLKVENLLTKKKNKEALKKANQLLNEKFEIKAVENQLERLHTQAKHSIEKAEKTVEKEVPKTVVEKEVQKIVVEKEVPKTVDIEKAPSKKSDMYSAYQRRAQTISNTIDQEAYNINAESQGSYDEMMVAFGRSYAQWDELLNNIYGTLKERLTTAEFHTLRDVQRSWIAKKDQLANEAYANPGDYEKPIAKQMALVRETSIRCYEMMEQYRFILQ